MVYEWYEIKQDTDKISQGDIIKDCPVPIIISDKIENDIIADIMSVSGIVMTQSCDIENKNLKSIILCPITSLTEYERKQESVGKSKNQIQKDLEGIIKGQQYAYHIINRFNKEGFKEDCYIINFKEIYNIPIDVARKIAKGNSKRLSLCPPYREHLSQAFARYFMRVGLPIPIELKEKE